MDGISPIGNADVMIDAQDNEWGGIMNDILNLEDLIYQNRISMTTKKVRWNPIMGDVEGFEGVEHYKCQLLKPGKQIEVYLSVDSADSRLTVEDVFSMLAMEASGCMMLQGYEQYRDELSSVFAGNDGNMLEMEEFWKEYQGRCRQTEELRAFLGDTAYGTLLQHFSPEVSFA